ncbi:phosphatase PAP2 family protein [Nonomuraea sp. NPDC050663]|uniref:phosphatase PAP2 family protein n=1 Tax=Nonomuraea sp. NPDC050663 TaxID=3364370 RepID=UPI003794DE77
MAPLLGMLLVTFAVGKAALGLNSVETPGMRDIAQERTADLNTLTDFGSSLSDTPYIVGFTALFAIVFRLVFKRWLESVFLILAVWSQSLVFLATTELVGRSRPPVEHLDPAPPTSSWPSGHVSAAVCFYGAMTVILLMRTPRAWHPLWWTIGILAPTAVGLSRIYRGMHFFSDVLWGVLLGLFCLFVVGRAILVKKERHPRLTATAHAPSP